MDDHVWTTDLEDSATEKNLNSTPDSQLYDKETGTVMRKENVLSQSLRGRHMQMIAFGEPMNRG